MVRLIDIAERVGVSVMTVSKALRDDQLDVAATRLACSAGRCCAAIALMRHWLRQCVLLRGCLKTAKLVPTRARKRARGIAVRGLCPLRPPGALPPLDPH